MDRVYALERIDDLRDVLAGLYDVNEEQSARLLTQADEIDYLRNVVPDPTLFEELERDLQNLGDELTRQEDELRMINSDLADIRISLKNAAVLVKAIQGDLQAQVEKEEVPANVKKVNFGNGFDETGDLDPFFDFGVNEAFGG